MENNTRELFIFNNLTRKKEKFIPQQDNIVKFYSCGPTTYDFLHVGNARALVTGDLFYRALQTLGYQTTFVRNFTDIDDKIIDRAKELGTDPIDHSSKFVDECLTDMKSLNMLAPSVSPKVSETIPEIIQLIERLLKNDAAYEIDGEVFFSIDAYQDYGKLSRINLEGLQLGKRVDVDERKKNPADFVLWKPSTKGTPGWESPWGLGRPGWHIECSAMAFKFLGEQLDIHHGGIDLLFPHHENEIAQSEAASHKIFSKFWCHHEFVNFGDEKMSKSIGNVITIRKFVEMFGGDVLRMIFLTSHYRTKLEWSKELINKAIGEVEKVNEFKLEWLDFLKRQTLPKMELTLSESLSKEIEGYKEQFYQDLTNDFNFPSAMSQFFQLIRFIRREIFQQQKSLTDQLVKLIEDLFELGQSALGLWGNDSVSVLKFLQTARINLDRDGNNFSVSDRQSIEKLILERIEAKKMKDWKKADQIRQELLQQKIIIADHPDGSTTWKYKE